MQQCLPLFIAGDFFEREVALPCHRTSLVRSFKS